MAEGSPDPDAAAGFADRPDVALGADRTREMRRGPVCPFLSAIAADDRVGPPILAPDPANRCLSTGSPAAIFGRDQGALCLDPAHVGCPLYVRATSGSAVEVPVPPVRRISMPIVAAVGLLVIAAVLGLASVAMRGDLSAGPVGGGASPSGAVAATSPAGPVGSPGPGETPTTPPAGGATSSPAPSASASIAPTASLAPTPGPTATTTTPVTYPGLTACAAVPDCYVYVVKRGDNLSWVAARYGLTLDEVLARNPTISDPSLIVRGQKVRLPTPRK